MLLVLCALLETTQPTRTRAEDAQPRWDGVGALVLCHVGMQRKPVQPVMLYSAESARKFRLAKSCLGEERAVKDEKCEAAILAKLHGICKNRHDWVLHEFGDTEFTFYTLDGRSQSFVLDKKSATATLEDVRVALPAIR